MIVFIFFQRFWVILMPKQKTNEQFLEELKVKNPKMRPLEKYRGANVPISFVCLQCGTVALKTPSNVLCGHKCSVCANNKKWTQEVFEEKMKAVHPTINVVGKYISSQEIIECQCTVCGYSWSTRAGRLLSGLGCPNCNKYIHTSFPEQAVFYYLSKEFPDAVNSYNKGLGKSEIDCFLPSLNVGIEYDGKIWHQRKREEELLKYKKCKELNIYLIRIREENDSDACDKCIVTKYSHRNYSDLDESIEQLFRILKIEQGQSINTERDLNLIKQQYYGIRAKQSLSNLFPEISKEWHQPKNGKITPDMVSSKTNDKYFWKCPRCQYVYRTSVYHRTVEGTGCPRCAGNLQKSNEAFLNELKIIQPSIEICSDYHTAFEKVDCRCKVCNHCWKATPDSLRRGEGCPKCANNIKKSHEVFVEEVKGILPNITVLEQYTNGRTPIRCKCKVCGYEWNPHPLALLRGHGCPSCAGNKKKKVMCLETKMVFETAGKAADYAGISRAAIQKCCSGKMKTAKGFHWIYCNDEDTK